MNNDTKNFLAELKKHYSSKFITSVLVIILIILIPVFYNITAVEFNPAEFCNTYLTSVFTAILIALFLQIIELYRKSLSINSNIHGILNSIIFILTDLNNELTANLINFSSHKETLEYYKSQIHITAGQDFAANKLLFDFYNSHEIAYVIESLNEQSFSVNKRNEIKKKTEILLQKITIIQNVI